MGVVTPPSIATQDKSSNLSYSRISRTSHKYMRPTDIIGECSQLGRISFFLMRRSGSVLVHADGVQRQSPWPGLARAPPCTRTVYALMPSRAAACLRPCHVSSSAQGKCPTQQAAQHHERTGEGSTQGLRYPRGPTVPRQGLPLPLSINPCTNPSTSRTRYGTRTVSGPASIWPSLAWPTAPALPGLALAPPAPAPADSSSCE